MRKNKKVNSHSNKKPPKIGRLFFLMADMSINQMVKAYKVLNINLFDFGI